MITHCQDIEGMDGITAFQKPAPRRKPVPKKNASYARICPHNEGILCEKMQCGKCGWNPKVIKARKKHD